MSLEPSAQARSCSVLLLDTLPSSDVIELLLGRSEGDSALAGVDLVLL